MAGEVVDVWVVLPWLAVPKYEEYRVERGTLETVFWLGAVTLRVCRLLLYPYHQPRHVGVDNPQSIQCVPHSTRGALRLRPLLVRRGCLGH